MRHKKNIILDAALVLAAVEGGFDKFMFAARNLGLSPNEAVNRSNWLKRQSQDYIEKVSLEVVKLEYGGDLK